MRGEAGGPSITWSSDAPSTSTADAMGALRDPCPARPRKWRVSVCGTREWSSLSRTMRSATSDDRTRSHLLTASPGWATAANDLKASMLLLLLPSLTSSSSSPRHTRCSHPPDLSPNILARSPSPSACRSHASRPASSFPAIAGSAIRPLTTSAPNLPPRPRMLRRGRVRISDSIPLAGTMVCLSGLFCADASFASILLWLTPALSVYPVSDLTAALTLAQTFAPAFCTVNYARAFFVRTRCTFQRTTEAALPHNEAARAGGQDAAPPGDSRLPS